MSYFMTWGNWPTQCTTRDKYQNVVKTTGDMAKNPVVFTKEMPQQKDMSQMIFDIYLTRCNYL